MPIIVYNRNAEDHGVSPNNYPIFRGGSILGNPFTHKELGKTKAIFRVRNREEAIERYSDYFDQQYAHNKEFKALVDEIFEKYKSGEEIYLECYCAPLPCHGDVIAEKLRERVLREKINEIRQERSGK